MKYKLLGANDLLQPIQQSLLKQGVSPDLIENHLSVAGEKLTLVTPFQKTRDYLEQEFQTSEEERNIRDLQRKAMEGWGNPPHPSPAGDLAFYYDSWSGRHDSQLSDFWRYVNDLSLKRNTLTRVWNDHRPDYDPTLPFIESQRASILAHLDHADTYLIYALYVHDMQTDKEKEALKLLPILQQRGVPPWLLKARIVVDTHGKPKVRPMPGVVPLTLDDFRKPITNWKEEQKRALSGDETASYRLFWHFDALPGERKRADQWLYLGALSSKASIWPDIERRLREREVTLKGLFELSEEERRQLEEKAERGAVELWPSFLMYRHCIRQKEKAKAEFWWRKMTDSIKHIDTNILGELKWGVHGQLEIQ